MFNYLILIIFHLYPKFKIAFDPNDNDVSELKKRSTIYWADELDKNSSLLILCGINDKRANPEQAEKIAGKLKEIKYDFELRKFETDHYFSEYKTELNELVIEWFDKRLKK